MPNPCDTGEIAAGSSATLRGMPRDAAQAQGTLARSGWLTRTSRRYWVCLGILSASALGMSALAQWLSVYFAKQPVPLRKPLHLMDARKLLPEYELHPVLPPPISEDMLNTLGTREYLDWRILDTRRPRGDPTRVARLFITYYTGQPDMVPHRPEECMAASGYDQKGRGETLHLHLERLPPGQTDVPVRVLEFEAPRRSALSLSPESERVIVLYLFHVNGRYATTREEVRIRQGRLLDRHAYYMKIEISFTDESYQRQATREQSVQAAGPLLEKVLSILFEDHLWDWEALKSGRAEPAATEG